MARRARAAPPPLTARVLIVDDDERNAFAASEALEVLGHELVVARSGEEALRLLLTQEFAVILLDLHMPGMDGYETARLIREHPRTRDTPIVFVTAVFRDEAHIFQAYSVGAVDVVFKPVDPFILRSKVAILADLHLKTLEVRRQAEERHSLLEENARISEEKLAAELALRSARERQDAILKSLPVVFTSRASVHPYAALFVSDSITPLTGFEPNRFVEEPEIGLGRIHPDDVPGVLDCLMQASETGAYACEYRWQCADGQYRTFLDQGVWVPDEDGGQILGTLLDVTERRHLEEQLTQARKMEAVGQLTGGVAHDFNNLLTVVLGNADILLRRVEDDPRVVKHLGAIRAAAERGQTLTRQLLAFSRRQQLNPQVVDLNALILGFLPLLRQAVGEAVTIDLALWDEPLHASVDPTHLETALLNLAVNARDAMDNRGRLVLTTEVENGADGARSVLIRVSDTGSGMSAEVAERIFEPFYTTKDVGLGSGLGLSQVYGFVNQSGGQVTVTSTPGEGATFELVLPATDELPDATALPASRGDAERGSERVLIVEDDPAVLSLCLEMLSGLGYRCEVAADGDGALHRLSGDQRYDLLFSDVIMPGGMNGIQLARRAQALRPDLRVLLTSGYLGEAAQQGPHEFPVIDKPYERADLARRIRHVLSRKDVEDEARLRAEG
ncbi:response regulator [Brevundimonas lenta]|uniref:histidine kinase n=1 Tax=Brevundimonas lenta TaxID=424796 RepID=A0A7W6NQ96_9CAUL|nr:response regulator [Brevundimonas lenta]MBB4084285.1 signal transduction histidine kinase/DNA-binding response OmpR family regulator [Brevundimonas lenta]